MPPKRSNLTTGPIASVLLMFALPTLGSSALQSANGSIDAVWIGQLIGKAALAATTNGNLVMFLLTAFVFGFGMAATVLIGQSVGRGDIAAAREVVGSTLGVFVPISLIVAVGGWFIAPHLLALLGTPADVTGYARDYLRVTFLAMPAILTLTVIMMALRGAGDAMTPLGFMALAVVLDVVLNPVLILGAGPLPGLGIAGSALATAIANYIALIALVAHIYRRDLPLRLRGAELGLLRPRIGVLRILFAKGLPIGVQMIVVSSSMLTMLSLVNREGTATTAAFGATQQLWTYVQMPAMALGGAVSAMAAQNIGAGRWDRVRRITQWGIGFNILLTGLLVVLLGLADREAMALFLGADQGAIAIGRHISMLSTWGFIAFGVTMVLFGTIRANGQVLWPLLILAISMYPVRLGFAFGLRGWLGADALWLSFPAAMLSTLVMAGALYLHGGWRRAPALAVAPAMPPPDAAPNGMTPPLASPVPTSILKESQAPLPGGRGSDGMSNGTG